jgi:hypothetical protein
MRKVCLMLASSWALCAAEMAHALTFGEVAITVALRPRGPCTHGTSEYVFSVHNESSGRRHVVTITIPASFGGMDDRIIGISGTVELEPGATRTISLLQPFFPPIGGNYAKVFVDGREYGSSREPALPVALSTQAMTPWGGGAGGWPGPGAAAGTVGYLLISREVPLDFPTGDRSLAMAGPGVITTHAEREDTPLSAWSTNWQGHSRYDAIVITAREWKDVATEAVRTALWQYAEAGGMLVFLGDVPLPGRLTTQAPRREDGVRFYAAGFGTCAIAPGGNTGTWPADRWWALHRVWTNNGQPLQPVMSADEANDRLPVVEEIQTPVRGLFVLMVVFTVVIGPGNLWVLTRMQRRIWMLWTVPAISFLTCALVFGYMLVVEGWRGQSRIDAITLLDENTGRATTVAYVGVYAPMTPSDGLHFSRAGEIAWLKKEDDPYRGRRTSGNACTIECTKDQHFVSGWVSARVPSHFKVRQSEHKPTFRLPVELAADGTLTASNYLGADIQQLWVADGKGIVYYAENVPAGAKATLTLRGTDRATATPEAYRSLLTGVSWLPPRKATGSFRPPPAFGPKPARPMPPPGGLKEALAERAVPAVADVSGPPSAAPLRYLAPRTYMAVLDSAPFIDGPLANTRASEAHCTILGVMKEKGDGN